VAYMDPIELALGKSTLTVAIPQKIMF
jgi:hypothetical protein